MPPESWKERTRGENIGEDGLGVHDSAREGRAPVRTSLLALLGSALYATVRYNIFKGVPWSDWPAYTLNKALALAALVVLVLSVVRRRSAQGPPDGSTLYMASVFASMHVLLSLSLLTPVYYENLFVQGKLTAAAGLSMALGAVAAAVMAAGKRLHLGGLDTDGRSRSLAILAFVVGLHAALQGFTGWLAPATWPGRMLPITLISFLLGLAAVAAVLRARRRP